MRSLRAVALFPFGRLQPNRAAAAQEGALAEADRPAALTEHSKRGMFSALHHRNFRLYIGGMLVATAGAVMTLLLTILNLRRGAILRSLE